MFDLEYSEIFVNYALVDKDQRRKEGKTLSNKKRVKATDYSKTKRLKHD